MNFHSMMGFRGSNWVTDMKWFHLCQLYDFSQVSLKSSLVSDLSFIQDQSIVEAQVCPALLSDVCCFTTHICLHFASCVELCSTWGSNVPLATNTLNPVSMATTGTHPFSFPCWEPALGTEAKVPGTFLPLWFFTFGLYVFVHALMHNGIHVEDNLLQWVPGSNLEPQAWRQSLLPVELVHVHLSLSGLITTLRWSWEYVEHVLRCV